MYRVPSTQYVHHRTLHKRGYSKLINKYMKVLYLNVKLSFN